MSEKHKKVEKQENEKKQEIKSQKVRVKAPSLKEQVKRQRKTVIDPDLPLINKQKHYTPQRTTVKAPPLKEQVKRQRKTVIAPDLPFQIQKEKPSEKTEKEIDHPLNIHLYNEKIVNFISLDKTKDNIIKYFPLEIRSEVSKQISNLLNMNSDMIINSLLNDINGHRSWVLNLSNKNFNELFKKLNTDKYRGAIINYFKDLIKIVQYIREKPKTSLRKIASKFSYHPNIISDIAKSFISEKEYYNRYVISSSHSKEHKSLLDSLTELLNNKKFEILNLDFIPTKENIIQEDELFDQLNEKQLFNKVRAWIQKNTNYNGVKNMIDAKKGTNSISILLYNYLDSRKADILSGHFIPNITNLSFINSSFNTDNTRNFVNLWLKKNSNFINLSDLIRHFTPTPTQLGYSRNEQEQEVIKYSQEFILKLNFDLSNSFIDIVLTMYQDILNFIDPNNIKNAFNVFYESMTDVIRTKNTIVKVGLRNEASLAGVLVYYSLLFDFYGKKVLTSEEKKVLINDIVLDNLEILFSLSKHSLRKKSPIIHNYLCKIPKYEFIFKKMQIKNLRIFRKNVTYNEFKCNYNTLNFLKNKNLRDVLNFALSNIKNNNFPSYIFDLGFPRASEFKFQGSNSEIFKTKIIEDYFIVDRDLVREITNSNHLYIICKTVQEIYNNYGLKSLGNDGHNIIENYFVNDFNLEYNIFPFIKELPVWKFNLTNTITGHIDIVAFYYLNGQLYFLILDFKPKGTSEILKGIPQLTIYGFLFRELLFNSANNLGINLAVNDFKIRCIGFNNTNAYAFNPFLVYDHIQDFLDYEATLSNRTNPISLDKKSLTKLVTFINLL